MIPNKIQEIFKNNPKVMVVVDLNKTYYRGLKSFLCHKNFNKSMDEYDADNSSEKYVKENIE